MTAPEPTPTPAPGIGDWQRLHPLSPILRGGVFFVAVVGYLVSQAWGSISRGLGLEPNLPSSSGPTFDENSWLLAHPLVGLAGVLAVLVLIVLGASVSWRFSRFRVADGQLELRTGWLFRQHRQVRLERVQAVEVDRPLLARLAGLAQVVVRSAGGADSRLDLAYLALDRAEQVRDELQRLAGRSDEAAAQPVPGSATGTDATGAAGGLLPGPAGRPVVAVPNTRLLVGTIVHGSTIGLVVVLVGVLSMRAAGLPVSWAWLVPFLLTAGGGRVRELLRNGNFRLVDLGRSLRVSKGLTDLSATTVPLHRVQAVAVTQNLWWRLFGWWRVEVNVAGVAGRADSSEPSDSTLLPVGTVDEALAVVHLLAPGTEPETLWQALTAGGTDGGWTLVSSRARSLDPLVWSHAGYAVSGPVLLLRRGLLTRTVTLVPHARIQSMRLSQGPLDARLGLVDVHLVSTPGPVSPVLEHLDLADGERLLREEGERSRLARRPALLPCGTDPASAGLGTSTPGPPTLVTDQPRPKEEQ